MLPLPLNAINTANAPIQVVDGLINEVPRFLRAEEEESKDLTWNDQLAKKYYENLYREFAVCDLKHYKSGNVRIYSSFNPNSVLLSSD
jgi:hypothetical protein